MFTLLDVSWSTFRLVSLGLGGLIVDRFGIEPLFWLGGSLLFAAGALGLILLGSVRFSEPE